MSQTSEKSIVVDDSIEVDLRNPYLGALLAWLIPGAGHLYQRRYAKGVVFMVCILSTYVFGLAMGGGHAVYASWREGDRRWQYAFQVGVGIPALPALIQTANVRSGGEPILDDMMAPPRDVNPRGDDDLARWNLEHHAYFEFGTLYTMIAGLLNILAIYDAYAGPFVAEEEEDKDKPPPDDERASGA